MKKTILFVALLPTLCLCQTEQRFVVRLDKPSDYGSTLVTLKKNTFVVLSPYPDSVSFQLLDMTGVKHLLKIRLFYFGDSAYLIGSQSSFDSTFSMKRDYTRFNRLMKKVINKDLTIDGLYPFTVVVDLDTNYTNKNYGYALPCYFSIKAHKVIGVSR